MIGLMSVMATDLRMAAKLARLIPQKIAERIDANMQEVPEAESQLRLKMARVFGGRGDYGRHAQDLVVQAGPGDGDGGLVEKRDESADSPRRGRR